MSGFDANFRNLATGDLSSFDGSADQYGSGNPPKIPPVLEPFMTLACGTTTTYDLAPQVGFSFFRTDSVVQNTRYNARQGNFVCDASQPIEIQVTARGFTPFVTLARNADNIWKATDGSGIIMETPGADLTGPFTVEVTSIEPYATGDFDIQISCSVVPTITLVANKSSVLIGQQVIYTATYSPAAAGHVIKFNIYTSIGGIDTFLSATTNSSGIAVLTTCNLGMHNFGTEPNVLTGPLNVHAFEVSGPTSNYVTITVTEPGPLTIDPVLVAYVGGVSGNAPGPYQTFEGGGGGFCYVDDLSSGPWMLTVQNDQPIRIYLSGLNYWVKSDIDLQCPKGTFTKFNGGGPTTVTVT